MYPTPIAPLHGISYRRRAISVACLARNDFQARALRGPRLTPKAGCNVRIALGFLQGIHINIYVYIDIDIDVEYICIYFFIYKYIHICACVYMYMTRHPKSAATCQLLSDFFEVCM